MTTAQEPTQPRLSRPISAVPIDTEVSWEIKVLLAKRLVSESALSEWVHVVLVIIAGAMAWPFVPHSHVVRWIAAVTAAALGRGLIRHRVTRHDDPDRALNAVRIGVAACGVAWGAGILLVGPQLPAEAL